MAVIGPQRKLRQGKGNEQGVPWEQAAKDEALWIEKKGQARSETGKAETERKDQGMT